MLDLAPHRDTYDPDNLLSRGQEVAVEVKAGDWVDLVLAPGEMSLHHVNIVHGSDRNRSNDRRIGFAARYFATQVRQKSPRRDSAFLVAGQDRYGHFDLEPAPPGTIPTRLAPCMPSSGSGGGNFKARFRPHGVGSGGGPALRSPMLPPLLQGRCRWPTGC